MATILESEAAFNARAGEHGITRVQLTRLQNQGIVNLSKLAFSITTPGTVPPDDALKQLLSDDPDTVTVGELSSMRRLMFDAQTLSASQIKTVLSGSDTVRKAELVPAERATRIQAQKNRLQGMELTGPLEASHASYDYVAKMLEADTPMYLEPHRFTTRASEVAREKPKKELVLDNVHLTVQDVEQKEKCQISNELELHQAFTRRSLACDLMQVCSFRTMEKWHRVLMDQIQLAAPPGFRKPSMEQILRADRAAWIKMAEKVTTLKRKADGTLPLNVALDELQTDPSVMFHLMPLPMERAAIQGKPQNDQRQGSDGTRASPVQKPALKPKNKGGNKGKGKGKSKPSSKGRMPVELVGLHQQDKAGKRLCYNFNLQRGCDLAAPGAACVKGQHSCMKCFGAHAAHQCSATVRRLGFQHGTAIDAHVTKQVKAPVIRIDLSNDSGQQLLWRILQSPRVFAIHLGPPCGTSSRAREIRLRKGYSPPPLRSTDFPDGLPNLSARDQSRVNTANILYKLSGEILSYATANGILCSLENPARSHMWDTTYLKDQIQHIIGSLHSVLFHHCAFGAKRKKHTKLLVNHLSFMHLCRECDGLHEHLPWGVTTKGWATALEVEYPLELCKAWAQCLRNAALEAGAIDIPSSLHQDAEVSLHLQAKAALGVQPRGKRLRPLMSEYEVILRVRGPHDVIHALPEKCDKAHVVPPQCSTNPPFLVIPAHSKRLRAPVLQGDTAGHPLDEQKWLVEYGVSWEPDSFVRCASGLSHPGHFLDGVHEALATLFDKLASNSSHALALERTEAMRKWTTRFQELRCQGISGLDDSPEHAKRMRQKNLQLFDELVKASGSPDVGIARDIAMGFDLMGPMPAGGAFPLKPLHATLLPEQVMEMASLSRDATWASVRRGKNHEMCQEIYKSVLDECGRGWMRGPFSFSEIPHYAVLTRRFGVQQTSTLADGSRVSKFRPIDDFSESLINITNSCSETILPMGVDQICAALVKRMQLCPEVPLVCKTIDLRKAYKNLPISEAALRDAYICVLSPTSGQPEAFQTLVLPFGARAAVMGFCRASYAIWRIGVSVFNLHWTVYFDDYFLVAAVHEAKHIDLAQKLLFQLTGWQTSDEKEGGFGSMSRILGVQIDLSEVHLGAITVSNVESRVKELTAVIDDILKCGRVTAAEINALRGRLVFAEAQIFGRLTGVHLKQLARLEGMVGEAVVDSELSRSLIFLRNRVLTGSPRRVLSEVGRVFHLYTDACFEDDMSGVGGVLVSDEGEILSFFSEQLSAASIDLLNPLKKRGLIFELEALAVLIGTTQLLHPMTLRPCDRVVVFVDNDAVLSRLVSGKRNLKLEQEIFQSILEWEYDASSVVWYERVPSHANIADGPSRGHWPSISAHSILPTSDPVHLHFMALVPVDDPMSLQQYIFPLIEIDRNIHSAYDALYDLIDVQDYLDHAGLHQAHLQISTSIRSLRQTIATMAIDKLRLTIQLQRALRQHWLQHQQMPLVDLEL
eukprot:s848_g10.t1